MAIKPTITSAQVHEFIQLTSQGMRRKDAAKQLGLIVPSLRSACKRLNIPWPGRTLLKDQLKEFEPEILAGTISQSQLARKLGCSQTRICGLFKELGYPSLPSGATIDTEAQEKRDAKCEAVLQYIEENGGYIKQALRELGFPESLRLHVAKYAKEIGFDLEAYRFAHRRYGYWLTLPGKARRYSTSDYHLAAVCTKCGTVHTVQLVNLSTGASTQCRACSYEARTDHAKSRPCFCVETGERLSSIRQLSTKSKVPYSTVVNHLNNGGFQFEGLTYKFAV